ncbi:MAG: hypothetical protein MMC33_008607 [Icmadophila ericetorum]|nr:hypothetical protein [Icmadophila ericetorum]
MTIIYTPHPVTGVMTETVIADKTLHFINEDRHLPEVLRMPDHRITGYPRVVDMNLFSRESITERLTLADAVVTTLFYWNPRALLHFLGVPDYTFICTVPDGLNPGTLIIEKKVNKVTCYYLNPNGQLRGNRVSCEIQSNGAWTPVATVAMQIQQTVTGVVVEIEAREMAKRILEMKSWPGSSQHRMEAFPSPGASSPRAMMPGGS